MAGPSLPPPPDNVPIAAWYRAGRAQDQVEDLNARLLLAFGQYDARIKALEMEIRALKLANRKSGHKLEEITDWRDTSEVRDLRKELEEAQRILKEREATRATWMKRIWALIAALIVVVATAATREFMRPSAVTQGVSPSSGH
jgi:hypothetical protein